MINVAMFGGSFNPVHYGHVELVKLMIEHFCLDKVLIIPTFITPLKDNSLMASSEDRLNMCKLAFSGIENTVVCDREITRQGRSYTVDTLKELSIEYTDAKLHFIVGGDAFLQLPRWHSVSELFSLAKVITVSRDEIDSEQLEIAGKNYTEFYGADVGIVNSPVSYLSSTKVRNSIEKGEDVSSFLPLKVLTYIKENGLYGYKNQ